MFLSGRLWRRLRIILWLLPVFAVFLNSTISVEASSRLLKVSNPPVIVIDPGHGGDNLGSTENGFLEKSMTMTTAKAMYDELNKFDNVTVYLTHTDDKDMSLKERAQFAAGKSADLLISIHYNASEIHTLYGSEVWISLQPEYHAESYQFATVAMRELRNAGMHLRGIKTKPSSKGDDYYGIIRESATLGFPAVILEHCHIDHPEDSKHCDTREEQEAYGVTDAHAVAKFLGLKSTELNLDYSDYTETLPSVSDGEFVSRTQYDASAPDICKLEISDVYYQEDRVLLKLTASDKETNLIYYSYSLDGGNTFDQLLPWPEGDILTGEFPESCLIELEIPDNTNPSICFRVYNPYDVFATSNIITFPETFIKITESEIPEETISFEDGTNDLVPADAEQPEDSVGRVQNIISVLIFCTAAVFVLLIILLVIYFLLKKRTAE